jgi:hypothetical protein
VLPDHVGLARVRAERGWSGYGVTLVRGWTKERAALVVGRELCAHVGLRRCAQNDARSGRVPSRTCLGRKVAGYPSSRLSSIDRHVVGFGARIDNAAQILCKTAVLQCAVN